jgi:ribose transport system substrate-binding protein
VKSHSKVLAMAVTATVAIALAGCSSGAGGASGDSDRAPDDLTGVTFAFAIPTSAGQVYVEQSKAFKEQAEKLGATVDIYDNNGDAATMLSNADLMVAAAPDVIVEYPSVADATDRVGEKFTDAGIPCIALNVPVEGCSFFNFDQVGLATMGAEAMAAQMKDRGWDGTNTTVLIGQASELGESVNIAVTTFYSELSKLVPGMTPVDTADITPTTTQITADEGYQGDLGLTVDTGYDATLAALQTIPADRNLVVYTVSDDTTFGVLRAIDSEGRTDSTMVSGYGGYADGLNQIRAGGPWVTDQIGFFGWWGEFVLAMAVAIEQGATPPELTAPPQVVVTKENVDTYFDPETNDLIMMPPLPPESEYLIDTGILQKFGNVEGLTE